MNDTIRTLHVDDDPGVRDLLASTFEHKFENIIVEDFGTVSDAVSYMQTNTVDCIISDYNMPKTDGIEFLENVREINDDIPFILYTGKGTEDVASKAISKSATDYIQKESGLDHFEVLGNSVINSVESFRKDKNLREVHRRFDSVLSTMPATVFLKTFDGRYLLVNDRFKQVFGIDSDLDVTMYKNADIFDEKTKKINQLHDRHVYETETETKYELTVEVGGDEKTHMITKNPVKDDNGNVVAICGVSLDITDRKQKEQTLKDLNEQFQLVVNGAHLGVWDWDLRTGDLEYNDIWASIFGYDTESLDNRIEEWYDRIHPNDIEDAKQALQEHFDGESEYYVSEHRIQHKEKGWVWVRNVGKIVEYTDGGDPARAVGIKRDIDTRKSIETELKMERDALLKEKNRLNQLMDLITHDIKNPLTVAKGNLGLLKDEINDTKYADNIDNSLGRIDEMIDEIASFKNISDEEIEQIDVSKHINQCWRNIDSKESEIHNRTTKIVEGNSKTVKHIFENIFQNSIYHNSSAVDIYVEDTDDGFYIEDNGDGIPEEMLDTLFVSGESGKLSGTGLGLSIVYEIVKSHDWDIAAENTDRGARFTIMTDT